MSTQTSHHLHSESVHAQSLSSQINQARRSLSNDSTLICDLTGYSIYQVTGADATEFLQGQFCNDIAIVSATQAQITGYCTPKGRLLALPIIAGFDGAYNLVVPSDVASAFIKRLSMFVMRADVQITHRDDWAALGLIGHSSGDAGIENILPDALPVGQLSVVSDANSQLIRWHDDTSNEKGTRVRYLRLAPYENQKELWDSIDESRRFTESVWRVADVSAGVPSIRQGVVEAFVPQMINLHHIGALSFTKGCYPGQEIVARMQYLGKLKRHMRVFSLSMDLTDTNAIAASEALVKPGQTLSSGTDENAGIIVDAMPSSTSSILVLAVTKVGDPDSAFTLGTHALEARDMPYTLPSMEVAEPQ